jgi:hypothetical protein
MVVEKEVAMHTQVKDLFTKALLDSGFREHMDGKTKIIGLARLEKLSEIRGIHFIEKRCN